MNENKPTIASKKSIVKDMEPGTYYWCSCGLSINQPFCDGSHKGSSFSPFEFKVSTQKKMSFCQCKHTKKQPFCDGEHNKL